MELIRFAQIINKDNQNYQFGNKCFMCFIDLTKENKSKEHIFPKWLLHKFDIFTKSIEISNRTQIPYRKLTIPCCKKCNNEILSELESKIKECFSRQFKSIHRKDEIGIAQWSAKLILGVLIQETYLAADVKKPQGARILNKAWLEYFDNLYSILQTVGHNYEFRGMLPWSFFPLSFKEDVYRYYNFVNHKTLGIQLGFTGFIITFEDNNQVKRIWKRKDFRKMMKGKLKLRKMSDFDFRYAIASIIQTKITTKGLNPTQVKFDKEKDMIIIESEEPRFMEVKWTDEDEKLVKELMQINNPEKKIKTEEKIRKILQNPFDI